LVPGSLIDSQAPRRQHPHGQGDREGEEHPGEQVEGTGTAPGDKPEQDIDAGPADRRDDPEHQEAEEAWSKGGWPALLNRSKWGQCHHGGEGVLRLKPGALVTSPAAFGEKRARQCKGAGDSEPDDRMKAALKEPPTPRDRGDQRENTEAELNIRLSANCPVRF